MKPRLIAAVGSYALLAVLASFTLEGVIRVATLVFLGGLAVKTLIALKLRS